MDRLNVKTVSQNISQRTYWGIAGAFLRIISVPAAVTIEFYKGNISIGAAESMLAGLAVAGLDFDGFAVTPSQAGSVVIVVGDAPVSYDRAAGSVDVLSMPAVPWSGTPNVAVPGGVAITGTPTVAVPGGVAITGTPTVNVGASQKIGPDGFVYGASYKSNTSLAANTPETVFTAAANVNGAILWRASFRLWGSTNVQSGGYVAKASAPANVTDGDLIVSADGALYAGGPVYSEFGNLEQPVKIPAGKGLYFIQAVADSNAIRSCLYTLL